MFKHQYQWFDWLIKQIKNMIVLSGLRVNPLTAGAAYMYSGFYFLLAHYVPPFEHVKDKMWH